MITISNHPVVQRLLKYISFNTTSVERSDKQSPEEHRHPSSGGQESLLLTIKEEMLNLGVHHAWIQTLPDKSFLVKIPATSGMEDAPHLCLAAHVDTYPGVNGRVMHPIIHDYHGGDIVLPENNITIPASDLTGLEGTQILTSDGTTLLGGDDKGGVAVIMTVLEDLLRLKWPHGPLTLWICVDEEIGELGFSHLDPETVNSWDMFLTVDGERLGPIDVGCFYCRIFQMVFTGSDAHPGVSPEKLHPSHYAAMAFAMDMCDEFDTPEVGIKDNMAPYFYVTNIEGNASRTVVNIAPRSFFRHESNEMVERAINVAKKAAEEFDCTVEVTRDIMATINNFDSINPRRYLLEPLLEAHRQAGIEPTEEMVRGGTDGSMLNIKYPNLATPNMGYGGKNLHGPYENVCLNQLVQAVDIVVNTITAFGELELPTT